MKEWVIHHDVIIKRFYCNLTIYSREKNIGASKVWKNSRSTITIPILDISRDINQEKN